MAQRDPLGPYFANLFKKFSLVDVVPRPLAPTWNNGRLGDMTIKKRIDRFFIAEALLDSLRNYRSWIQQIKISDHLPIIL